MAKSPKTGGVAAEIVPADVIEKARALLTAAEKKFFTSSFGAALAKHTQSQVQAAVKQARILRNKWRDLLKSQSRTAKRSGRATAAANERTRAKHDILSEVVARFERRLEELKAPPRQARRKVAKPVVVTSKKASRRITNGLADTPATQLVRFDRAKQRSALTAAKASRIKRGGQGTQRLGHAAASGRRAQKRRDIHSRG